MKTTQKICIFLILLAFISSAAVAAVNTTLTFTNYTDEELYIELSVRDDFGDYIYDLYVLPGFSSIADFWVDTVYAAYDACAYGEITGDFYGCFKASVSDADVVDEIYFDAAGEPYAASPSDLPAEWYVFDNPHPDTVNVVDDGHGYFSVGCFIGSLLP